MIRYFWLGVAIAAAVIFSAPAFELLPSLVDAMTRSVLPGDYSRLLRTDPLISTVGKIAAGAVILTGAGFGVLAAVEGALVAIARNRLHTIIDGAGPKRPLTKALMRDALSHAPFLDTLTRGYISALVPVHAERKMLLKRGKETSNRYETLEAVRPSGEFVGPEPLVNRRLFLWLFGPVPVLLWSLGVIAAAFAIARLAAGGELMDWSAGVLDAAVLIGIAGLGALASSVIIRPLLALRRNQAERFAADLDGLLRYQPVTNRIYDLQVAAVTQSRHIDNALKSLTDTVASSSRASAENFTGGLAEATAGMLKSLRKDIEGAISEPLKALTETAARLSEDQSAQIQQVLRATLKAFVSEIEKHVGGEIKESRALLKAVADQATKLEKSYADANRALAKQAKAQASDLSGALDKALKSISALDKSTQATIRNGLSTAAKDLSATADKLKTLSATADKLVSSVKPALDDVGANQKALLDALKSQDSSSKVIGSAASDLKAASKASKDSVEAFVGLAEKMRQATNSLKNGGTVSAERPAVSIEIGKGLKQLRQRTGSAGKELPKL